jgi:hypothetical protein
VEERGLPLGELAAHGAGWQAHVEDLDRLVARIEPRPWHDQWVALTPAYEQLAAGLG